jgi:hypothetical protein
VVILWISKLLLGLWRIFVGKGMGYQGLLFGKVLRWIMWIVPGVQSAIDSKLYSSPYF